MTDDIQELPPEEIVVPSGNEPKLAEILLGEVKELVAKSGGTVRSKVVQHLVDTQIEERANCILKGLDKRNVLVKDLQKCRPDQKLRTQDGKIEERFSDQKWKEKIDLEDKLKKLDKALEEAFDKAQYESLKKAVQ
jgi:hypothetical protein